MSRRLVGSLKHGKKKFYGRLAKYNDPLQSARTTVRVGISIWIYLFQYQWCVEYRRLLKTKC